MADHRDERAGSFASSSTDAATLHELTKLDPMEDSLQNLKSREEEDLAAEDEKLLPSTMNANRKVEPEKASLTSAVVWMTVNTLATIGIVFTNKAIFSDPQWKLCQLTFASFHFLVTFLTLHILSRPTFAYFIPRRAAIKDLLPLSVAMCLNVILPNLSLAFSSVTFYQIARILLTPTVALMNFVLYKATLPRNAVMALIPACFGVGMVSYYDSLPTKDDNIKTTSTLGVFFAFTGIFASSLYTVWIASYHRKLQMSSMQLLYNQAPIASFLLLYVIPFVDTFPDWVHVPGNRWIMIGMSGVFASLINISQFFIIAQTGPVSSTVVGHLKTCTIVGLGWMVSGRAIGDKSILGVFVAIGGIIGYSVVMLQHQRSQRK
ncbi:Solute carrier family 35 member E3 [Colletotrichum tanaceti]|uniref:GDP-mannose transporter n=1 Tax=Colletotrichum tanaceti TaxID=1306861 RepID=A0A4U6X6U5_9PEZI|nr:Solute carrier family 35 member E3 [Colletotrichum tanaceti]TKW50743.1 Solute carrier family 35 member E3 [Colletotrichum tanaceti]